jgi:hypothetical protein
MKEAVTITTERNARHFAFIIFLSQNAQFLYINLVCDYSVPLAACI